MPGRCLPVFQIVLLSKDTWAPELALGSGLWELCPQWLQPETHTKEQILDLLVLEHFLTILPQKFQSWLQEQYSESGEQVTVLEDLEKELNDPGERRERECELSSG